MHERLLSSTRRNATHHFPSDGRRCILIWQKITISITMFLYRVRVRLADDAGGVGQCV